MQKGEHVKDTEAKRSNVEITSIVDGRLLTCVRQVLSYTLHREHHAKLLAHAQQTGKEKEKEKKTKCEPTVQTRNNHDEVKGGTRNNHDEVKGGTRNNHDEVKRDLE